MEGVGELEVTRRVIDRSMQEVFHFLKFTTEVGEEEGGWLPTLDLKIRVEENNQVSFSYYEKPTVTNVMVQRRSAMEENNKIQILVNDMVRRLANTDPRQGKEEHCRVVDMFAQKLLTSGYSQDQAKINKRVNSIQRHVFQRDYQNKLAHCQYLLTHSRAHCRASF